MTVSLDNEVAGGFTVDYSLTDGTAESPDDFDSTGSGGTLTFAGSAGDTATIIIPIVNDSLAEFDENFTVSLDNVVTTDSSVDANDVAATDSGTVTILNDDTSELVVSDVFVQETQGGTTTAVFTVSIDNGVLAAEDITFDFTTVDGTALSGSDFVATSGTETIAAGDSSVDITVVINGDTDVELDETFTLEITNPTFAGDAGSNGDPLTGGPGADNDSSTGVEQVEIIDAVGEATINNDDALVEFVLSQSESSEDGSPTGPVLFIRGDLTDVPDDQRFVTLQTVGGTAIRGLDFLFGDGDNNDIFEFLIPAEDFSDGHGFDLAQYDVNGVLTSESGNAPILDINDDNLIEGEENIVIEIQGVGDVFTVAEAVDPDPLVAPADPAGFNPDTNHIIGDNDTATVTVIPTGVTEEGGTQNFDVVLNTSDGDGGTAILAPTITGVNPGVTITADVENFLADGTASASDFTFNIQDITFNPGEGDGETRTLEITPTSDEIVEADETVALDFANTNSGFLDIAATQVTFVGGDVTILEDATDTAALTVSNATFDEDAGAVTVDVTLNAEVQDGFTIDAILTNITTSDGDFISLDSSQGLTFSGSIGEVQTVSLTINDDAIVEGIETLEISLDNLVTATAPPVLIDTSSVGTVTILEDATDTAAVTVSNAIFDESAGTVTVDVTVDAAVEGGFTVDASLTDITTESGDTVSVSPQTLTFVGGAGEVQTVTLEIVDDAIVELAETLEISLDNLATTTAPAGAIDITSVGTVTISEDADDTAAVTVDSVTVNEDAGTITVNVTLDAAVEGGFTVDAVLTDITTESGDTVSVSPQALTFAGNVGEVQTVTLTIVDDAVVELAESLEISLANLSVTSAPAESIDISSVGTVTISEDAADTAAVTVDSVTVNEGDGTITVDVTLNADVEGGFNVDAVLADVTTASGDTISTSPQTLTFAGNSGETQTVTLTIVDDSIVELTESLTISLDNLVTTLAPADAIDITSVGTVTIEDNDEAEITLTAITTEASEQPVGDGVTNASFTLNLSNESSTATVVNFTATPDAEPLLGAIREGFETSSLAHLQGDYRILADGVEVTGNTLTIPAGATSVDITIEVIDDVVVEVTENFEFTLTSISSADDDVSLASGQTSNVTIGDDDQAEIIVKAVQDASEPGQSAADNGFFQVLLVVPGSVDADNPFGIPAPVSYDVEVLFSTTGTANQLPGDPSNPVDFEELEPVVFAPGVTTDVIAVTPEDDLLVEVDETVTINLTPNTVESSILDNLFNQNVTEVSVTETLEHQSATVVIEDNDVAAAAPQVEGIYVNGTNWTSLFRDRVDGVEDGSTFGYELTNRADPNETVPWVNVDQIIIEFDSAIDASTISTSDFSISGLLGIGAGATPGILSAVAGPGGNTVVLTLTDFLQPANVTLGIDSSGIQSTAGVSGVDSTFEFIALPGDADMSQPTSFLTVNAADITDIVDRQFEFILPGNFASSDYEFFADLNGDGVINAADITAATVRQFDFVIPV